MALTTLTFDHQELLKCSVPIWPTQLRRYTETALPKSLGRDYMVQEMQTDLPQVNRRETRGDWEESTHPLGATFYYNKTMRTYTKMNLRTCSDKQLQRLKSWINASRAKLRGNLWFLVVEQMSVRGKEIYLYYYVVPEKRIITWLEPVDGYLLFQECTAAWHWNHKRLELEAQFWKHIEYFPVEIIISREEVRALQAQLNWYQALVLERSTAASLFWNLDQMKEMASELAIAVELAGPDGVADAPGVAICGERHGNLENSRVMTGVSVAMLWILIMVLKRLQGIYVNGLVSGVDIKKFTDDFNAQAKAQTTVASIIMAVDASILAIPGLGSQLATKVLCSISFILSVYCIVACTIAQQFSSRMRSLDFAVYYMQGKMINLVILASIPSFMYLMSLTFSILGFLAGIFTIEFGLDVSAKIGCVLAFIVGASFTIPLVIASFGPGLIR
ncbi:uncharacterized protein F5891DRAFT_1196534 [Suillus fuscotomentosus]|uniref:Uncharacterized protein n=1 Tax=Suillus fuscotomentosus TaxID=1912939 RepID=A0AAD4DT48_9AGAM|nr:uncharacterized protein F5891DRAFT_1196534 [Suillus fuscotomentosus]KAG1893304.1 hypothetical protein F5891DRAFT_1196534 [Suillus fuscotomentosus]